MLFYDFEVFKYDWLVVIKDTDKRKTYEIVNDVDELTHIYELNKNNIWVGYNSRSYDQWILKAIISGFNPKELNDWIIEKGKFAWQFSNVLSKIQLYNYDVMTTPHGLKQLEGFMGHDIRETTVSFDIDRKLTEKELKEVIYYCEHDVEETMAVFINRIKDFEAHMALIKEFKLPLKYISKTQTQLVSVILGCKKIDRSDEFNIQIADTIKLNKYKFIKDWYLETKSKIENDEDLKFKLMNDLKFKKEFYKKTRLEVEIFGVMHTFAWGGLHGALDKFISSGLLRLSDVGSFYPSLMIIYKFLSRNVENPQLYEDIYNHRMKLKHEGKKKEQAPFKLVLNKAYGGMKDRHNALYDPLQANNVCINGQLMLLDLIEKVEEKIPKTQLGQSNTDGVMFEFDSQEDLDIFIKICDEWCCRTGMTLEHDKITKVIQKDVNNYCIVKHDGKLKTVGGYLKETNILDNNLPIIQSAIMNYFIKGIPPEKTILNETKLMPFQQIVKVSRKYKHAVYDTPIEDKKKGRYFSNSAKILDERVFRVFASRSMNDKGLYKVKLSNDSIAKCGGTPEKLFIDNSNITEKLVNRRLDKQWYIDLAWKRIKSFNS